MIYLVTNNLELFKRPSNSGIYLCSVEDSLKYLNTLSIIGADTETTGMDEHTCKLLCLQLGDRKNQYVIDTQSVNIQKYKDLLMNKSKTFIWQNAAFDLRFLFKHKLYTPNIYDTYLAESAITRGLLPGTVRKGLDALVYRYCKMQLDKTIRGNIHREGLSDRVIRYAADDVKYLEDVMIGQKTQIDKLNLERYVSLENQFVLPLAYTMHCGFYLDREQWTLKAKEDKQALNNVINELDQYVLDNYSSSKFIDHQLDLFGNGIKCKVLWSSSKQVIELFQFLEIDVTIIEKGKKKQSVDQKHLNKIKDKHSIIPIYLKYSKKAKQVSTYGLDFIRFINSDTNRVHTTYNQILNTGRISSGKSDKQNPRNDRPNLQNIPSDSRHRSCFKAMPGNTLEVGDYTGQEQIVLANKSMEPNLLEFYDNDLGDMHSFIASKIFPELNNVPLKEIKEKHSDLRQIAKIAGFSINYGGTGYTIANNQGIDRELADKVYEDYFKSFSKLRVYFRDVQKAALSNGYILTNELSNSKTFLATIDHYKTLESKINELGFWDLYRLEKAKKSDYFKHELYPVVREYFMIRGKIERDALNFPIQGTSAEITKLAAIKFFNYLIENNLLYTVLFCNMVHDEIVIEYPNELKDKLNNKLKYYMEEAGSVFCKRVPLKAEPKLTLVWDH